MKKKIQRERNLLKSVKQTKKRGFREFMKKKYVWIPLVSLAVLASQNWDGHVEQDPSRNDFLLVDANLASLKTDPAVFRTTDYRISEQSDGSMQVHITRTYENTGKLNWKTTRYRTHSPGYTFPKEALS